MTKSERKRSVHGGGSVFQRKNDQRWVAKFKVEETGKWKELYAKTEKEAKEKLQQALFEQKQGVLATGPKQTVKQYLERWLEIHRSTIKVSTYALYRRHVRNHLIRLLGHIQLQKLTADQVLGITLNTYSHVLPSMQQDAMDKWDGVFRQSDTTDTQHHTHESPSSERDEERPSSS